MYTAINSMISSRDAVRQRCECVLGPEFRKRAESNGLKHNFLKQLSGPFSIVQTKELNRTLRIVSTDCGQNKLPIVGSDSYLIFRATMSISPKLTGKDR